MIKREALISSPDMNYLNQQVKNGRIILDHGHIFYQNFHTADGVLVKVHETAGRFYGGGISQFSWDNVYKNGKLVFRSKNINFTYKYFERYLKKLEKGEIYACS